MFRKVYNLNIVLLVSFILFLGVAPANALRLEPGEGDDTLSRFRETMKKLTSGHVIDEKAQIYDSMDEILLKLPLEILRRLEEIGLDDTDILAAEKLLDLVGKVYESMRLLTKNYHNHVHNLAVTHAMLLLTEDLDMSLEDKKVAFIAALFHDFHVRATSDIKTGIGTPAFVEETLRQLADMLQVEDYPGYAIDNARYAGEDSIIDGEIKKDLREVIQGFLGGEIATGNAYPKIVAMIRRTDFASDVAPPQDSYKQMSAEVRQAMDVVKMVHVDEAIDIVRTGYKRIYSILESDIKIGEQRGNTDIWLRRQEGIELSYLEALKKISFSRDKLLFHKLAHRLEKGADQSGIYYLCTPEMVERDIVPGLNKELPFVTSPGTYPFFFSTGLLLPEVLTVLGKLPEEYKDNFCKLMRHFSKLSTEAGKGLPDSVQVKPLFLNAENDWNIRSAKVAYILGMSVTLLRESILGGFLTEAEMRRLISEARITMYDDGTEILRKDDAPEDAGVYEILSGEVNVVIGKDIVTTLAKGDIFDAIGDDIGDATVMVAIGDSIIAEIPAITFFSFYNHNEDFRRYFDSLIETHLDIDKQLKSRRKIDTGL